MKLLKPLRFSHVFSALLLLVVLGAPRTAQAQQNWRATVGAQSKDMARQVIAFLPNEIWIHAGDRITWTFAADDIHTVTFLTAGQPIADFTAGCPGFAANGASFDGPTCVTTPPMVKGQSFTITFPTAGNYKLVCLVHSHMTAVIHVLNPSAILPHDQDFYDDQAADQRKALLTDRDTERKHEGHHDLDDMFSLRVLSRRSKVTAGIGEMAVTPGGFQSLSVVRFLDGTIEIHTGDTVEWSNFDPAMPHTITIGTDPANPGLPSTNFPVDEDGAPHATINSPTDTLNSGIIVAAPEDQFGVPQNPPGLTRFRITFIRPGTYNYQCALHDNLGMVGKVIVLP